MLRDFDDAIPWRCRLFVVIYRALLLCNVSIREKWDASRTSGDRHLRYFFGKLIIVHTRWRWHCFFYYVKFDKAKFWCRSMSRLFHVSSNLHKNVITKIFFYTINSVSFFLHSFPLFFPNWCKTLLAEIVSWSSQITINTLNATLYT